MSGFRLSISNCPDWTTEEASRELIANLNDAIIEASGSAPTYVHEVSIPDVRYCVARVNNVPYGSIAWRKSSAVLELINQGVSITVDNLTDIGTSKKRGTSAVGQFGEGLKSALGPFIRSGCTITFQTPSFTKSFVSQVNTSNPADRVMVMVDGVSPSPLPSWVDSDEWTRVIVTNIKEHNQVAWDSFLFLLPRGNASIPVYRNMREPVLLRGESRTLHKVYVQDVLVCSRADLPFGLALDKSIKMNRDRSSLRETSSELLLHAVSRSGGQFNPEFIKFMFRSLNRQSPDPVFEDFSRTLRGSIGAFTRALFDYGKRTGRQYYACLSSASTDPEQRKLLAMHPRERLRKVCETLFRMMWPLQRTDLERHYNDIIAKLRTKAVPESVLTMSESRKLGDLQSFLRGLMDDQTIAVVVVNSTDVFPHTMNRLAVYDRFPCIWEEANQTRTLILERALFNRKNIHLRVKADMAREQDRANQELFSKWQTCTDRHCVCLQSTVMVQVQSVENISTAYCTRFMLHWSKAHHEAVRQAELAGELGADDLNMEPEEEKFIDVDIDVLDPDTDNEDEENGHDSDQSGDAPPPPYSPRSMDEHKEEEKVDISEPGGLNGRHTGVPDILDASALSDQELSERIQRLVIEQSKRLCESRQSASRLESEKQLIIQEMEDEEKRLNERTAQLNGRKRRLLNQIDLSSE